MSQHRRHIQSIAACLAVALLAACEAPTQPSNYRAAHPIVVTEEIVTVALSVPADGGLVAPSEEPGFGRFVRIFQTRAKGPITLHVDESKGGGVERSAVIERTAQAFARAGVGRGGFKVMPGTLGHEGPAPILATFPAYKAIAPECGDWSKSASFNFSNTPHSDYGCSYQRNLALTVANPADFVNNQPMSAYSATRGVVSILTLEAGGSSGGGGASSE